MTPASVPQPCRLGVHRMDVGVERLQGLRAVRQLGALDNARTSVRSEVVLAARHACEVVQRRRIAWIGGVFGELRGTPQLFPAAAVLQRGVGRNQKSHPQRVDSPGLVMVSGRRRVASFAGLFRSAHMLHRIVTAMLIIAFVASSALGFVPGVSFRPPRGSGNGLTAQRLSSRSRTVISTKILPHRILSLRMDAEAGEGRRPLNEAPVESAV
jgi:hypothetical protein